MVTYLITTWTTYIATIWQGYTIIINNQYHHCHAHGFMNHALSQGVCPWLCCVTV